LHDLILRKNRTGNFSSSPPRQCKACLFNSCHQNDSRTSETNQKFKTSTNLSTNRTSGCHCSCSPV